MKMLRIGTILILSLLLSSLKSFASHLYGADFFYTHVSGNTYTITMVIYGDCNINTGSTFLTLSSSTPEVKIFDGTSLIRTINLSIQSPSSGVEVTPVCASQLGNTTCSGGTIPGVKKFTYSANTTLNPSANWKFVFTGVLGSTASAGRSNSITNIVFPAPAFSSTMMLEATLNNLTAPNSSPSYTTIPTPFFCISKAASYNPGAVDANGDNLVYSLVPGLEAGTGSAIGYNTGFSATAPLAVTTGTFSFSSTTGQLNFTPNAVQRSLVVNKVEEYRGTTLVGSSMREMTFVVLNNCSNNPPGGVVSSPTNATVLDTTTIRACKSAGTFTFNINPVDPDADNINVQASGLPAGATFTITGNNTASPTGLFSWNAGSVAPGTYTFFITYTDNGCPLSSKQTTAYTIIVTDRPSLTYQLLGPATCARKAKFRITPTDTSDPWSISILQGSTTLHSFTGVTTFQDDSLSPGSYTIRVVNNSTCFKDTNIVIAAPPVIIPTVALTLPTCFGGSDGAITVSANGGAPPFLFAQGAGAFSGTNSFSGLTAGSYTFSIKDTNVCIKDTTVLLNDPPKVSATVTLVEPPCNFFSSGVISINGSNGTIPYQYAMGAGSYSSTNVYSGLVAGNYTIHVKDAKNCILDTVIALENVVSVHANALITDVLCNGAATGAITMTAFGATSPYKYKLGTGTLSAVNSFTGLTAGTHTFHIEDANRCYLDTSVLIAEPARISSTSVVNAISCNGLTDGTITITATGGKPTYTYAIGAGTYSASGSFTGLAKNTHTLHIKDANNCIRDTAISITEPDVLRITGVTAVQPTCFAAGDGSFTLTATGGTLPYTYAVNAGTFGTSSTLTGLVASFYALHVKDARGCAHDTTATMTEPTQVNLQTFAQQSTCTTLANGKVLLSGSGGVPGYTYAVGTGSFSASPTFTPLAAGTYNFRVRDSHSCEKMSTVTISDSLVVKGIVAVTDVSCFGQPGGSFTVSPLGGISPYTFALGIGGFGSSSSFTGLTAGSYMLHIRDVNGCVKDTPITIAQPVKLGVLATATDVKCNAAATGVVNLSATGGSSPYTFANGTGAFGTTNVMNGLPAGTYTFHIKDNKNCIKDTTITLSQPSAINYTLDLTNVLCHGEKSGQVVVNAGGGTAPYTFASDNNTFQTSNILGNIGGGTHAIHLIDANGCVKDTFISISVPPAFSLTGVSFQNPKCNTTADGSITLNAQGGTPPYTYGYVNGATILVNTITGLGEGSYTFFVKDSNNCVLDTLIALNSLSNLRIADVKARNISCFNDANGEISVQPLEGIAPFSYSINGSSRQTEAVMRDLKAGKYTISVFDEADCRVDTTIMIESPRKLEAKAIVTSNNDCQNTDNGGVIATDVTGGTQPYNYLWKTDPPRYGATISGIANGSYFVTVTDANNCGDTATAMIMYEDCCNIFIPDAFTPNNDGRNDRAKVMFKGDLTLKQFSIYNRFGQMVFRTSNPQDGWDGMLNGEPQDLGTYNYYMEGICGNGGTRQVHYKGTITLIR